MIWCALLVASSSLAANKPAPLRTAAIPDGQGWFCSAIICEREQAVCGDQTCTAQPTAWVATGRNPKTSLWDQVAAPTAETCKAAVATELAGWTQLSACAEVGATQPLPPDKALIPRGTGWWCFADERGKWPKRISTGAPRRCFRTEHECVLRYHGISGAGAVLGSRLHPEVNCLASATAFLLTTNGSFAATVTATECEAVRRTTSNRTACATVQ